MGTALVFGRAPVMGGKTVANEAPNGVAIAQQTPTAALSARVTSHTQYTG
jgi:hypothetical protein